MDEQLEKWSELATSCGVSMTQLGAAYEQLGEALKTVDLSELIAALPWYDRLYYRCKMWWLHRHPTHG